MMVVGGEFIPLLRLEKRGGGGGESGKKLMQTEIDQMMRQATHFLRIKFQGLRQHARINKTWILLQ